MRNQKIRPNSGNIKYLPSIANTELIQPKKSTRRRGRSKPLESVEFKFLDFSEFNNKPNIKYVNQEVGKMPEMGEGLLSQAKYSTGTYEGLTAEKLKKTLSDLFYGESNNDK